MIPVHHAVIDDNRVYFTREGKLYHAPSPEAITPALLIAMAEKLDVKTLWILAGSRLDDLAKAPDWYTASPEITLGHISYVNRENARHGVKCFTGWRVGGRSRYVSFARYNNDWNLDTAPDAISLLAALAYVEHALGVTPYWSAASAGQHLMRKSNIGTRHAWTEAIDLTPYPDLLAATTAPQPRYWHRPLTPEERARKWLVAIDKNSAWPAACTSAELGIASPVHLTAEQIPDALPVGCWRVSEITAPAESLPILPLPDAGACDEWYWTPSLLALHKLGYRYTLAEGYAWAQTRTILRPWAEHIWQARQTVRRDLSTYPHAEARDLAQGAIKGVAVAALGWLHLANREPDTQAPYHRPDWYALIRDHANRIQLEQVARFSAWHDIAPVMIHSDALYYAIDSDEIEQSLPGIFDRQDKLGGFKDAYKGVKFPIADVADLFAGDLSATEIHRTLQRLASTQAREVIAHGSA